MTKDLTPREAEIYAEFTRLLPEHTSEAAAKESVAKRFGLSAHTVRKYVSAARRKGAEDVMPLEKRDTPFPANPVFPDKKQPAPVTFERVLGEIKRKQQYHAENSYSQDAATWQPQPQYPDLPIALAWMPDVHFGSLDVDYEFLESHLKTLQSTPNMYVAFGGDMINNFNAGKIPEGIWHDGVSPEDQMKGWANLLERLDAAHKLAVITWGNHDEFSKMAGINAFSAFFGNVSCPLFIDGGGVLHAKHGRSTYHLGMRHTFWGNSKLNQTNASKRMMQFWRDGLDAAFLGHVHTAAGEDMTFAGQQRIAVVGGTYKLTDGFSKRWIGDPQPGGFTVLLYPDRHHMQLCRYPEDAADIILGKIARLPKDSEPQIIDAAARFRADPDESEVDDVEQSA